jgi:hypothetical protein
MCLLLNSLSFEPCPYQQCLGNNSRDLGLENHFTRVIWLMVSAADKPAKTDLLLSEKNTIPWMISSSERGGFFYKIAREKHSPPT